MQASAIERRYAKAYATVGYAPAIMTIPDRPFTATRVYQEWARKSDSGKPTVVTTVTIARDTAGRIHFESSRKPGQVAVIITDPIAHIHYEYDLSPEKKVSNIAARCTEPLMSQLILPKSAEPKPTEPSTTVELPKSSIDQLGTKEMLGAHAYGQHRTAYTAFKSEVRTQVTDDWFAPELGLNLLEVKDFSGQNKFAIEVRELELRDPDPNLFQLPSGYLLPGQTESCVKLPS